MCIRDRTYTPSTTSTAPDDETDDEAEDNTSSFGVVSHAAKKRVINIITKYLVKFSNLNDIIKYSRNIFVSPG